MVKNNSGIQDSRFKFPKKICVRCRIRYLCLHYMCTHTCISTYAPPPPIFATKSTRQKRHRPLEKSSSSSRGCAPETPERAAQKEQPASQPGNANATKHRKYQRFVAGVARARQKARKPTGKSKDRAAREPATAKAKRTEQQPTAQRSSF